MVLCDYGIRTSFGSSLHETRSKATLDFFEILDELSKTELRKT